MLLRSSVATNQSVCFPFCSRKKIKNDFLYDDTNNEGGLVIVVIAGRPGGLVGTLVTF